MLISDFDTAIRDWARSQGWAEATCPGCGRAFYTRRPRPGCDDVRAGCAPGYGFIGRRRGVYRTPADILAALRHRFARAGFRETALSGLVGAAADTLFVVAGVQVFDDVLRGAAPPHTDPLFVPQPSVRVRSLEKVGRKPGISSSFVNVCSEQLDGDGGDFARHLDAWLDAFAGCGLDLDGLTLLIEPDRMRRDRFAYRTADIDYFGLELGEAIMLWADDGPVQTILDFGFGFERLVWAANEADSYFSLIGPPRLALAGHARLVDFVRTMTLLAAAGLGPSNNGTGYVLRKLGRLAAVEGAGYMPLDELVRHSHDYWSAFVEPVRDADACIEVVRREIGRAVNASLAGTLGLNTNRLRLDQGTDQFLLELVSSGGVGYGRLREALTRSGADHG